MKLEELGAKTKAKYPQYANLSDREVGLKMIEKYPVYKKQISGTGFLTGLYNLAVRPTVEGAKGFGELATSAGKTVLGSMLSNGATNNTNDALGEAEAIKQARLSGNNDLAKQLADKSRNRYKYAGQVSDALLQGGEKVLDSATQQRQNTGLEGSFDQGIGSGMKTVGVGALRGAGGVLSALDVATLGKGSLVKNLAVRGVRNTLLNAPIYGVGNVAQKGRENISQGKDLTEGMGSAVWEGVTGSNPVGPFQGVTGDETIAPIADVALSLGTSFSKYGKWADKTAQTIVNNPIKILEKVRAGKMSFQEKVADTKRFFTQAPKDIKLEDVPDSAVDVYKSRFVKDVKKINEMGVDDPMDQASRRAIRNGWATFNNRENVKVVNDSSKVIGEMVDDVLRDSGEFGKTSGLMDKTKDFMKTDGQGTFYDTKYKNSVLRMVSATLDANQEQGDKVVGRVSMLNLRKAEQRLGEVQSKYYKQYNRNGDVKAFDTWLAIKLTRDSVKDLIASAPISTELLNTYKNDNFVQKLTTAGGPVLANDIKNANSIRDIQTIWRDLVELKQNSTYSIKRSARDMKLTVEAFRGAGVLLGLGTGNPALAVAGWLGAPLIQQPLNALTQSAKGVESNILTKLSALKRLQ